MKRRNALHPRKDIVVGDIVIFAEDGSVTRSNGATGSLSAENDIKN